MRAKAAADRQRLATSPATREAGRISEHQTSKDQTGEHETEDGAARELDGRSLALILVAAFMVVLDFSIVNVALPSIEREFGFSAAAVQWVVTGYAIAFGGLLILGGRAADLFGRRRMFMAGLLAFSVASLAGGLAQDPVLLVVSRVVQGAGAAVVAPAAFSLITTGFAEGARRNRALGRYGAVASVGFVAGQVLGGVLVQYFSWRAVFLVNVPVGVAAMLLAPRLLAESRQAQPGRRMDVAGAALVTTAVAALVFAVSQAAIAGWTSPVVAAALALTAAAAAVFWVVERRHQDPLVRADLLRLPSLRRAGTVNVLLGLWNGGEMLVLSIYFQQVLHDSPLVTGLAIAPQGVVGFAAGMFGARVAARVGIRRVLIFASGLAMVGFLVLTQLPASGSYSLLLLAVMPVGLGTASTAFATMVIASGGVADSDQGLIGGVINTSRQLGAAIGAALLPAVAVTVNHTGSIAGVAGDRAAMLTAAAAAGLAMLIALARTPAAVVSRAAVASPAVAASRAVVAGRSARVRSGYRASPGQAAGNAPDYSTRNAPGNATDYSTGNAPGNATGNATGRPAGSAAGRVAGHAIIKADAYHSRHWGRWEHRQHAASAARRPRAVAAAARRGAADRQAR